MSFSRKNFTSPSSASLMPSDARAVMSPAWTPWKMDRKCSRSERIRRRAAPKSPIVCDSVATVWNFILQNHVAPGLCFSKLKMFNMIFSNWYQEFGLNLLYKFPTVFYFVEFAHFHPPSLLHKWVRVQNEIRHLIVGNRLKSCQSFGKLLSLHSFSCSSKKKWLRHSNFILAAPEGRTDGAPMNFTAKKHLHQLLIAVALYYVTSH